MVTVEALVSGLPVIGTNDGGTVSLIEPGRNGFLVEPRNVKALETAMATLLEDRDLAVRMGATAQKEAVLKYSHLSQCEACEKLFADLG